MSGPLSIPAQDENLPLDENAPTYYKLALALKTVSDNQKKTIERQRERIEEGKIEIKDLRDTVEEMKGILSDRDSEINELRRQLS